MPEIRPFAGDVDSWMASVALPFGWTNQPADTEAFAPLLELDRSLAAYDGDRVVGTASAFSLELSVPGGSLPMAGVTMVGVHPTHRRRGLLRAMMRRQLDDVHGRGEPLAGLKASEGAIYQRFGYGLATLGARFEIDRARATFRRPQRPSGTLRLVSAEEAARAFPPVFDRVWLARGGSFARTPAWWQAEFFHDPEHDRRGGAAAALLLHETDGLPTGYARYRLFSDWDERGPRSALEVHEALGVDPGATEDLWRYLLDIDLVATVRARNLPVDHPLPLLLAEPRRLGWSVSDALWLRLVDLPGALGGRTWAADGSLVLEVDDEFCAWNAGRWRLTVSGGRATVERTSDEPDLELEAGDLAALYLGGLKAAALAAAGRIRERRPGGLAQADAMLRVDLAPWCPQGF